MSKGWAAAWVVTMLASVTGAHAQLTAVTRDGDRMINDATLNVTWADVASPTTLIWSRTGAPRSAQAWVASLNTANGGRGYGGCRDWRLPTGDGSAPYSPVNSANELGSLFYTELQNAYSRRIKNLGPFTSLSDDRAYWSSSPFAASPDHYTWGFNTGNGRAFRDLYAPYGAIAVRSGQVSSAPCS
jgi:hypothetical protein